VDLAMEQVGIVHLGNRVYQTLSGGEQQLVQLGRALAQSPCVLLLDEPTANLDVRHQANFAARIREMGGPAVLVCSHDVNAVGALADRVLILSRGRIVAEGRPQEVLTPEWLGEVFGVRAIRTELFRFE
jgi:iron complex transport system ATP-binding protein